MSQKANKMMLRRMLIILLCFVLAFVSVGSVRLIKLMIVDGEKLQSMASEQQLYDTLVSAPRGNIYDCKMSLLAKSDTAYNIYIMPNSIRSFDEDKQEQIKKTIATELSAILSPIDTDGSYTYEKIYDYTEKETYYVTVKKRVDKDIADKIRAFVSQNSKLGLAKCIGIDETTKRYYPGNNLAAPVLGFVGDDNQGLEGLESYYDTELTGAAGRVVAAKNALGADMPFSYQVVEEAKQGNSLVLTIDTYIQHIAEKYLEKAVKANLATNRGACIVMNVNTGAILGMAVKGDFNPNAPFEITAEEKEMLSAEGATITQSQLLSNKWRNKAVVDTYEPGSVFKIITASMALEEDLTTLDKSYNCGYTIYVGGRTYHCHKHGGHGTLNFKQALVNSCNPVFITIGQLVGVQKFSKYFEAFGLTSRTGIDLPGEALPVYHKQANMGSTELASSSFGQTFKISPIQLITAASAVVNGGYLLQPYVVSKIIDADGNIVKTNDKTVKRQVISEATSKKLREMMNAVVADGGASNAKVAGYDIGGKTGTSEKVAEMQATGQSGLYIASFLGVAPINDPEIAVLVLIDEPRGANHFGSVVAAPVAAEIFGDILPYLGYEPQYTEEELDKIAVSVPNLVDMDVEEAKNKVKNMGLGVNVIGSGETVIKQLPGFGEKITKDGTIIIYTDESADLNKTVTVPDFTDMSVAQVNQTAANSGLNIQFSGNTSSADAKAYDQSAQANTQVALGTTITVYFREETLSE